MDGWTNRRTYPVRSTKTIYAAGQGDRWSLPAQGRRLWLDESRFDETDSRLTRHRDVYNQGGWTLRGRFSRKNQKIPRRLFHPSREGGHEDAAAEVALEAAASEAAEVADAAAERETGQAMTMLRRRKEQRSSDG